MRLLSLRLALLSRVVKKSTRFSVRVNSGGVQLHVPRVMVNCVEISGHFDRFEIELVVQKDEVTLEDWFGLSLPKIVRCEMA